MNTCTVYADALCIVTLSVCCVTGTDNDTVTDIDIDTGTGMGAGSRQLSLALLTDGNWDLAKVVFVAGLLSPGQSLDWAYACGASDGFLSQAAFDVLVDGLEDAVNEYFETDPRSL